MGGSVRNAKRASRGRSPHRGVRSGFARPDCRRLGDYRSGRGAKRQDARQAVSAPGFTLDRTRPMGQGPAVRRLGRSGPARQVAPEPRPDGSCVFIFGERPPARIVNTRSCLGSGTSTKAYSLLSAACARMFAAGRRGREKSVPRSWVPQLLSFQALRDAGPTSGSSDVTGGCWADLEGPRYGSRAPRMRRTEP